MKPTVLTARMLPTLLLPLLLATTPSEAGNYILTVDGRAMEISLNQALKITTNSGEELSLKLTQKEFLEFEGQLFSMQHKNHLKPNTSDLGDNVLQTMMATPLGTGIIVQEYIDMNPAFLIDMMLNELTKEEKDYGYEYAESEVIKTISGKKVSGKQAVTSYPGEKWTRAVLAFGGKDRGILIVTMIEEDAVEAEQQIIDDFWNTLHLKIE